VTTRQQIDEAISLGWYNPDPRNEHEFNLTMAVFFATEHPEVTPIYDDHDVLVGWKGIRLKTAAERAGL